jgi:competence protein ComEA
MAAKKINARHEDFVWVRAAAFLQSRVGQASFFRDPGMDPASGAIKSGEPSPPAATPAAGPALPLTWPIGVQIALVLLVTASAFFLLGRWSQEGRQTIEAAAAEPMGRALDLNRATKAELRLIPGIGDALAQRIIAHRQRIGAFRSVDELRQVAGIGPKTLERIRHQLFVTPEESLVSDDDGDAMSIETKPSTIAKAPATSKKLADLKEPINVNRATQAELQKLPGIGPKLSQRILDERTKAAFKSVDELRRVPGIGVKTLDKVRPFVTVGTPQ